MSGSEIFDNDNGGINIKSYAGYPSSSNKRGNHSTCGPTFSNNYIFNNNGPAIKVYTDGNFVVGSVGNFTATAEANLDMYNNIIAFNKTAFSNECRRYNLISPAGSHKWVSKANIDIVNNSFYNNDDITIWTQDSAIVNIQNTIFYAENDSALVKTNGSALLDMSYSLSKYHHEGNGNIIGDPLFINPDNMDFSLTEASPAIDAGNPNSPPDPDGTRADIGAIPYMQPTRVNNANIYTFELLQNYPNPFNPSTEIKYSIPATEHVELIVYDILGKHVKTLVNKSQKEGWHSIKWDGINEWNHKVASGLYLYKLKTKTYQKSCKMLIVK